MKKILVLGGTRFVGKAMVDEAVRKGHQVTLLHRGQSASDLRKDCQHIIADRMTELHKLGDQAWDSVIDVCGYFPRAVQLSVDALKGKVGQYVFVSTISVYANIADGYYNESSPLAKMPKGRENDETVDGETYGALKVLCEKVVEAGFPNSHVQYRPGLVVGPNDVTDRFTFWVRAAATEKKIEIPTSPNQPVQIIDARDLAALCLKLVDSNYCGTVMATGPNEDLTFGEMWDQICRALGTEVDTKWEVEGTGPAPLTDSEALTADLTLAKSLGLTNRTIAQIARDVWAWDQERGQPQLKTKITTELS